MVDTLITQDILMLLRGLYVGDNVNGAWMESTRFFW